MNLAKLRQAKQTLTEKLEILVGCDAQRWGGATTVHECSTSTETGDGHETHEDRTEGGGLMPHP